MAILRRTHGVDPGGSQAWTLGISDALAFATSRVVSAGKVLADAATLGVALTTQSSAFSTPNIVNNADFETNFSPFTAWDGVSAPTGVTRATDFAYTGTTSIKRAWTPNGSDTGAQFSLSITPVDRIWVRFYIRQSTNINTIMKCSRWYGGGLGSTGLGGVFSGDIGAYQLSWGWDTEDQGINTRIGVTTAQFLDGNWHSLEYDYQRNGATESGDNWPNVGFWWDGVPIYGELNGTSSVQFAGAGGNKAIWKNGRLYAGERLTSARIDTTEKLATLNGGVTTTGQVNMDRVAISSVGRIGP